MQRRNVDLPDPDGPSMHITSPRPTSRSIPLSTSSRPNRLWTPSALTIGRAHELAASRATAPHAKPARSRIVAR